MRYLLRSAPRVPADYVRRYKYIVDADGNVQSNRFRHQMTLDAILLKPSRFVSAYAASLHLLPHVVRGHAHANCY